MKNAIKHPACRCSSHRHSIYCILTPDILRNIAENGTEEQRRRALATMAIDTTFRTLRAIRLAAPTNTVGTASVTSTAPGGQKQRTIYDAKNKQDLPGKKVRTEGQAKVKDVAVNEAYDGLGTTYDFFWDILQRNSIDDNGMPLTATVHYDIAMSNAFWDGERMVFGDGDGDLFNRFTSSLDVIGHELTHGVTEFTAQLVYTYQSGALNESLSDVFGCLIKQYKLGKQDAGKADWLIGQGLIKATNLKSGEFANGLRSMKAPGTAYSTSVLGKDPQPGHMKDFVVTNRDNRGVHINSGIPNKAFYNVAVAIGGFAGDVAGRIWYESIRDTRLRPNASFQDFACVTFGQALRLFGTDVQKIVQNAWKQVGITTP